MGSVNSTLDLLIEMQMRWKTFLAQPKLTLSLFFANQRLLICIGFLSFWFTRLFYGFLSFWLSSSFSSITCIKSFFSYVVSVILNYEYIYIYIYIIQTNTKSVFCWSKTFDLRRVFEFLVYTFISWVYKFLIKFFIFIRYLHKKFLFVCCFCHLKLWYIYIYIYI